MALQKSLVKLACQELKNREQDFCLLSKEKMQSLLAIVSPPWHLKENGLAIEREIFFKTYKEEMAFVSWLAHLAESASHHPDIFMGYKKAAIALTTHSARGLSLADFVLAAKIEEHLQADPFIN